jgi:hypothetical protein
MSHSRRISKSQRKPYAYDNKLYLNNAIYSKQAQSKRQEKNMKQASVSMYDDETKRV